MMQEIEKKREANAPDSHCFDAVTLVYCKESDDLQYFISLFIQPLYFYSVLYTVIRASSRKKKH